MLALSSAASAETHKFKPTAGVAHLRGAAAGAHRQARRHRRDRDVLDARATTTIPKVAGPWPGEVGPFHIEGAAPGDTLVVRIVKLTPNRDIAVSNVRPNGISGVAGDSRTRMLNEPLAGRRFIWQIDRTRMVGVLDMPGSASKRIELPLRPMLGRVAVAPAGEEAWGGLWPGDFGGNMDASDVGQGATVYLPVFHPGALFYFGDFHALQGDGEIAGSGLESTADVTFQFDLIKGKSIRWPRIENDEYIMVAGSVRPLIDALRIAYVELIDWLVADYGFDKMDAYQVASQAGVVRVANVVDPNYTVVAKFPKRFLPPRRSSRGAGSGSPGCA